MATQVWCALNKVVIEVTFDNNSSTRVQVEGKEASIIGIDDYGYLRVQYTADHKIATLHPDGNSFDLMQGLVTMKSQS